MTYFYYIHEYVKALMLYRNLGKEYQEDKYEDLMPTLYELVYLKENEPMEILHYKLDTNKTEIYNFGKKSLIQGLVIAYKNHFPIIR